MKALNNIDSVIEMLRQDHEALFGESSLPGAVAFTPIQRPYSTLVRVRLDWKERSRGIYVKFPLNPEDPKMVRIIREEYMLLSWFNERLPLESGYAVVRPLRLYEEFQALVTEEAEGTALDIVMQQYGKGFGRSTDKLTSHYRRCGEWLREFQSLDVPPFCRSYMADEAAGFVKGQLKRCAEGGLLEGGLLSGISSFINVVAEKPEVGEHGVVPMHSDFIPSNIIIGDKGICVLDFAACWGGPACRDVATFLSTLEGLKVNPFFRPALIERLKGEFLKGYGWDPEEEKGAVFMIFEVREILGRILQLSKRIHGIRSKIMYKRMQSNSVRRLREIIGD